MITQDTASAIWRCYRDIECGEKLLAETLKEMERYPPTHERYAREYRLEMGVPMGDSSRRLLNVHPTLGLAVIRAHIAEQHSRLVELNEVARLETASESFAAPDGPPDKT